MNKIYYLYGFMGAGKTYFGEEVSKELGLRYIDADSFIENEKGLKIPEIFSKYGSDYFRECEFTALNELIDYDIISLGGGALTYGKSLDFAKRNGKIVFIDTPFEICYERIKNDANRPNANGKSRTELVALHTSRLEHYRDCADFTVTNILEFKGIINDNLQR